MKNKHSFGFVPKYSDEISPKISPRAYIEIAKRAYEKLNWDLIYVSDTELNGLRIGDLGKVREIISIKVIANKQIHLQSKSENGIWDMGKNYKRISQLKETIETILNSISSEEISQIEKDAIAKDNWEDYIEPETLSEPKKIKEPFLPILIFGYLVLSCILSYVISFLSLHGLYFLFLFESVVGFILAYSLRVLLPLSNCTEFDKIKLIILSSIVLLFIMNQYFQFLHFQKEYSSLTFFLFIKERLKHGFLLKNINIGTIGQLVVWAFQIGFSYLIAYINIRKQLIDYSISRVPNDVIEFAMYNMVKKKSEQEIKIELSKKGWKSELEHKAIFEAIGSIYGGQQMNRNI